MTLRMPDKNHCIITAEKPAPTSPPPPPPGKDMFTPGWVSEIFPSEMSEEHLKVQELDLGLPRRKYHSLKETT
jgi:hypothetical protein